MSVEPQAVTNNPMLAIFLYVLGLVLGTASLGLEDIDIITAIVFRVVSVITLIAGMIASWKKITDQLKSWFS